MKEDMYLPSPRSNGFYDQEEIENHQERCKVTKEIKKSQKVCKKRKKSRKLWEFKIRKNVIIRKDIFAYDDPTSLTPRQQLLWHIKAKENQAKKINDEIKEKAIKNKSHAVSTKKYEKTNKASRHNVKKDSKCDKGEEDINDCTNKDIKFNDIIPKRNLSFADFESSSIKDTAQLNANYRKRVTFKDIENNDIKNTDQVLLNSKKHEILIDLDHDKISVKKPLVNLKKNIPNINFQCEEIADKAEPINEENESVLTRKLLAINKIHDLETFLQIGYKEYIEQYKRHNCFLKKLIMMEIHKLNNYLKLTDHSMHYSYRFLKSLISKKCCI